MGPHRKRGLASEERAGYRKKPLPHPEVIAISVGAVLYPVGDKRDWFSSDDGELMFPLLVLILHLLPGHRLVGNLGFAG